MEEQITDYLMLEHKAEEFITKHYSEIDSTTILCLLKCYAGSMETAYKEYDKASIFSKRIWKKRLIEQIINVLYLSLKYVVLAPEIPTNIINGSKIRNYVGS